MDDRLTGAKETRLGAAGRGRGVVDFAEMATYKSRRMMAGGFGFVKDSGRDGRVVDEVEELCCKCLIFGSIFFRGLDG